MKRFLFMASLVLVACGVVYAADAGVVEPYFGFYPEVMAVAFGGISVLLTSLFTRRHWSDGLKRVVHWGICFAGAVIIGIISGNISLHGIDVSQAVLIFGSVVTVAKAAYEAKANSWKDIAEKFGL